MTEISTYRKTENKKREGKTMNNLEAKRKELETIILNNPEICDELLRYLESKGHTAQNTPQAGAADPAKSST